jgi:hypothetical protein
MLSKLKKLLAGKKTYIIVAIPALLAIFQYLSGIDLGIADVPMPAKAGDLLPYIYAFGLGGSIRAAIQKSGQ